MNSTFNKHSIFYKIVSAIISFSFVFTVILPPQIAQAQLIPQSILNLPVPGTMVLTTPGYAPTLIKAITIHPENALLFDFIVHSGDSGLQGKPFEDESRKLIKYFLAALTIPENELWVNLSPYEGDRIISAGFGQTEMGRDLLAQDYILKQLTSSLTYPEDELGQKFWERVYSKAQEKYGTTDIPMNTFNKVWIVPDKAVVFQKDNSAFIIESHLKVMLEEDYAALKANMGEEDFGLNTVTDDQAKVVSGVSSEVVREVLIPEIEKEVNEGKNFVNLRQIFNSVILSTWFKQNLKNSLLGVVYVDKKKVKGVDIKDKEINQKIYDQYVAAFKKGVFNYIREDYDSATEQIIPRKYFSGGTVLDVNKAMTTLDEKQGLTKDQAAEVNYVITGLEGSNSGIVTTRLYEENEEIIESAIEAQGKSNFQINEASAFDFAMTTKERDDLMNEYHSILDAKRAQGINVDELERNLLPQKGITVGEVVQLIQENIIGLLFNKDLVTNSLLATGFDKNQLKGIVAPSETAKKHSEELILTAEWALYKIAVDTLKGERDVSKGIKLDFNDPSFDPQKNKGVKVGMLAFAANPMTQAHFLVAALKAMAVSGADSYFVSPTYGDFRKPDLQKTYEDRFFMTNEFMRKFSGGLIKVMPLLKSEKNGHVELKDFDGITAGKSASALLNLFNSLISQAYIDKNGDVEDSLVEMISSNNLWKFNLPNYSEEEGEKILSILIEAIGKAKGVNGEEKVLPIMEMNKEVENMEFFYGAGGDHYFSFSRGKIKASDFEQVFPGKSSAAEAIRKGIINKLIEEGIINGDGDIAISLEDLQLKIKNDFLNSSGFNENIKTEIYKVLSQKIEKNALGNVNFVEITSGNIEDFGYYVEMKAYKKLLQMLLDEEPNSMTKERKDFIEKLIKPNSKELLKVGSFFPQLDVIGKLYLIQEELNAMGMSASLKMLNTSRGIPGVDELRDKLTKTIIAVQNEGLGFDVAAAKLRDGLKKFIKEGILDFNILEAMPLDLLLNILKPENREYMFSLVRANNGVELSNAVDVLLPADSVKKQEELKKLKSDFENEPLIMSYYVQESVDGDISSVKLISKSNGQEVLEYQYSILNQLSPQARGKNTLIVKKTFINSNIIKNVIDQMQYMNLVENYVFKYNSVTEGKIDNAMASQDNGKFNVNWGDTVQEIKRQLTAKGFQQFSIEESLASSEGNEVLTMAFDAVNMGNALEIDFNGRIQANVKEDLVSLIANANEIINSYTSLINVSDLNDKILVNLVINIIALAGVQNREALENLKSGVARDDIYIPSEQKSFIISNLDKKIAELDRAMIVESINKAVETAVGNGQNVINLEDLILSEVERRKGSDYLGFTWLESQIKEALQESGFSEKVEGSGVYQIPMTAYQKTMLEQSRKDILDFARATMEDEMLLSGQLESEERSIRWTGIISMGNSIINNMNRGNIISLLDTEEKKAVESLQRALQSGSLWISNGGSQSFKNALNGIIDTLGKQDTIEPKYGGIDLDPKLLDLQIKRDDNGIPLPLYQQPIERMQIEGFIPVIINVTPVTNLPLLIGYDDTEDKDSEVSMKLGLGPVDRMSVHSI